MDGNGIFPSELMSPPASLIFFLPLSDQFCFHCHLSWVKWGQSEVRGRKIGCVWLLSLTGEVAEVFQSPDVLWNSSCWKASLASTPVLLAECAVLGCWYSVYSLNHGCPFQCINSSRKNCFVTHHPVELLCSWGWKQQRIGIQSSDSGAADAGKLQLLGAGISLAFPVCVALHAPCPWLVTESQVLNGNKPPCHLTNKNWFSQGFSACWLHGNRRLFKLDKSCLYFRKVWAIPSSCCRGWGLGERLWKLHTNFI